MVKLTEVPQADPAKDIAQEIAAETIQETYRRYKDCKPAIKLKRINSEEKLVQDIAADVIKGGIKRFRKNKIPGTPPLARPSPRANTMAAQEATGRASWLEVKKIVAQKVSYKRWDDGIDPYVEINGMVKTGVIWNGRGKPLVWTKTDSVVPVIPGENELQLRLYDANRLRDDVLIGECIADAQSVPDMSNETTIIHGTLRCPRYSDAKIEIHLCRSMGPSFPNVDEPSIRADHRKISVEDLDISSDVKNPRDLRDEAKRLAEMERKQQAAPAPPPKPANPIERAERKVQSEPPPAPPRKESQPRRESKVLSEAKPSTRPAVAQSKATVTKHELPVELKQDKPKSHHTKGKSSSDWLQKNVEAEKKLVIDDAYSAAYNKIICDEGVYLDFGEVALILSALGHEEAVAPKPFKKSKQQNEKLDEILEDLEAIDMEGQPYLSEGLVHIPLGEPGPTGIRRIAALFTELVHMLDFGVYGTHNHSRSQRSEEKEETPEYTPQEPTSTFTVSTKDAKIIKEHLINLATGMWTRNRNFILLVCGAHPEQGGGRPSNWSVNWVQKMARKLEFPEGKFMSCNGLQFIEENRNTVKSTFGIVPSLLQTRYALYQHILRLIESWWTIPSRPSDRVDAKFKETRKASTVAYIPFAPVIPQKPTRKTFSSPSRTIGKKDVHRMTLSPTYVQQGGESSHRGDVPAETLGAGDTVTIGPCLLLLPVLLEAGRDHGMDVRDHMFEKYAELVAGRSGVVTVFPYGRHDFSGMAWVSLRPEEDERPEDMAQLARQLAKVDVTDILVSGKHVLIPEVCLMNTYENTNLQYPEEEPQQGDLRKRNLKDNFDTIGYVGSSDRYVSKQEAEEQNRLANAADTNWNDNYSDDGGPAYPHYGGDENYPPSPEQYIGGGHGMFHAVVTAPLPEALSERRPRAQSAPHARRHNDASPASTFNSKARISQVEPSIRESGDGTGEWDTVWSHGGTARFSPETTLGKSRSVENYPTPEKYINGGNGVAHAVVIAPLRDPVPNRTNHEKLPDSPPRDHSGTRPLYRPSPHMYDTVISEGSGRPMSRSTSRPMSSSRRRSDSPSTAGDHFEDAEDILRVLAQGIDSVDATNMKQSVRSSVDQYNRLDSKLRSTMKKKTSTGDKMKPRKRRHSFDPLKEPASSRPKPEEKKKKKKKIFSEKYANEQDDELRLLIEKLENIDDVDELQDIQDSIAGVYRKRTGKTMGTPVRDPKGVYPDGIIDSMIKYKLNHDGDSNSAKLKMKKWGLSADGERESKRPDSDTENAAIELNTEETKAPHTLNKDKFLFPWMVGGPRTSDDIDPKKNERLWRALKVAERESAKKEAHLRRELRRLGVQDKDIVVKDPYDAYTNV